jgi:hypothetical protein
MNGFASIQVEGEVNRRRKHLAHQPAPERFGLIRVVKKW